MPRPLPPRVAVFAGLLSAASAFGSTAVPSTSLALRAANPDMLSSGVFAALEADGVYGVRPTARAVRAGVTDQSKGKPTAVLDPRVGSNVRLGDDPATLPLGQSGQAEPHIARSIVDPNVLLATFQEGRFSDAGALDCGYAVSRDGGLTWTRALIPQLTQASGGPYNRATDPVAAIGPQGDLYLNTLGSLTGAFSTAAVVVSRSTDNGATWSAPSVVFQSTTAQVSPDKNWMTVDDYAGTLYAGRLVVTWTNFTSNAGGNATGNNLLASFSDDRGTTWSSPAAITPAGAVNQGTQPVFLPDGSLVVVYITFTNPNSTNQFSIECKRSTDGGRTFPATSTVIVPSVAAWDDPDLRDGVFLPAAVASRQTGELFVTYTAVVAGSPRVLVTKSSDSGATWSTPAIVSDNPAGVSVVNPAIAVTPDGSAIAVAFLDKRNASDGRNFVDTYAALSTDGGATWLPNVRLSDITSDIRNATATTRGYMLGDYQGIAATAGPFGDPRRWGPFVAIWCDARTGDADPFVARFVPNAVGDFTSWQAINGAASPQADVDGDGELDLLEYVNGTDPHVKESGEDLVVTRSSPTTVDVVWTQRPNPPDDRTSYALAVNPDLAKFVSRAQTQFGAFTQPTGTPLTPEQLPRIEPRPGLVWVGYRFTVPAGAMVAAARTVRVTNGLGQQIDGNVVTNGTDSRLINVATRGVVGTGASQMILGFVVDGQKSMLLRAVGPGLSTYGVTGVLPNPQLKFSATGSASVTTATTATTASTVTTAARVGAFPLVPPSADQALLQTLAAGSYTAVVADANGASGAALVEAYDADATPGAPGAPRIVDLSTRGAVDANGGALIAGFVINGTQARRVLIRAVGPSLATFGVAGALSDPMLTVNATATPNTVLATNDDWEISRSRGAIAATAQRLGAFPLNAGSLDAALLITLAPGGYTVSVTGVNGATGVALVEVYDAD